MLIRSLAALLLAVPPVPARAPVIDAASIDTREPDRDAHLRSAEFLDVEKFPTLRFTSMLVTRTGQANLEVEGDLTIHESGERFVGR